MSNLYKLIGDIRYEISPGVHTFGYCSKCHVQPARGAGICKYCRLNELSELVGEKPANEFYRATVEANEAIYAMEKALKNKVN